MRTTTKRTTRRALLHSLFAAVCLFSLFSCLEEYESKKDPVNPSPNTPGDRQEVLLTLKNKLKPLTKATDSLRTKASTDLIATDAENEIASMDVFVFGSDEEDGTYSFQELLYYRADGSIINQQWASAFDIKPKSDNESTALLQLKKGLYVKLYVIANQPGLAGSIDGAADETKLEYKQFSALVTGGTGDKGREVLTMGLPTEDNFKHFRTPLLSSDDGDDVLLTPLTMVGSHVTPIDLTDFTVNARMQIDFKLNRLSARFDVVNDATASKLTIQSISMANGRSGVGFFPIKPYRAESPLKDDLITYFPRKFEGAQTAADKLVKGAFYSYPSPIEDKAYLIVNGIYAVNLTERKEVTYQIPFKQVTNGTGNYVEIAYNHRYTLYITDADEYHLDVDIRVADWDEAGSIDDYQPDTAPDSLYIEIDPKNGEYHREQNSVSLYLDPANFFTVTTASNAEIEVSHSYDSGDMQHDWLLVKLEDSHPNVKAVINQTPELKGSTVFKYKISPDPQYKGEIFPRGRIVFQDKATGGEHFIYVRPFGKPEIHAIKKGPADNNPNDYVDTTRVLTMHRALGSTLPLRVVCPDGSKPADVPAWLTVEKNAALSTAASYYYDITIKDTLGTSVAQPYELKFANEKQEDLFTAIRIELRKADIDHQFLTINPGNKLNDDSTQLTMPLIADNKFQLNTTSINGVKVDMNFGEGKPQWLRHDGEVFTRAGDVHKPLVFQLNNDHLVGAAPVDITITNNYQGENFTFRVIPTPQAPALPLTATSSTCSDNKYNYGAATLELYKLSAKASETVLDVKTPGGCEVVNPNSAWLQVRKDSTDYQTCRLTFSIAANATPPTNGAAYNVTLRNMTDNSKTTVVKVSPKYYPVPTVAKQTSNPTASTLSGTNIKIYKLASGITNFTIRVNSSLGGSKISYTGTGITLPGTVSDTGTEKLYTLTANAIGKGTLRVMNNQDNNRYTDYAVEVINPTITASNQNVTAANSGATNINVACVLPVTATPQWGNNTPWFDITTQHTAASGKIVITQRNNTNTIMKAVTIRLTHSGGVTKDIVVTPTGFVAPKLSATSGSDTDFYLNTAKTFTFNTTSAGGGANATTSNSNVATVTRTNNTYTVTPKGLGTCTISVPNASNTNLKSSYTVTVSGKNYQGKAVWKYYGYYIAPEDAGSSTWNTSLTATYCSNKSGATWCVPSDAEWRAILGGTSGNNDAAPAVFNEYKNKGVFASGAYYWSSAEFDSSDAYYMRFSSSIAFVDINGKSNSRQVRCVAR